MGQKVNPHGMRVGVIDDWDSKWFAEKDYAALLVEDAKIRQFLKKHLFAAGISKIGIKRVSGRVKLAIYTAKPGMVIGRGGTGIEDIKKALAAVTDKEVDIDILEIKSTDMSAILVGEKHRFPARKTYRLPPCCKTVRRQNHARWCQGYQSYRFRPSGRC